MQNLFSGRYNRAKYIWTTFLVALPIAVLAVILTSVDESITVLNIVAFAALSPITVKRLHDVDKPGWYYLLFLVPLANLILGLYLLFKKGTQGTNKFGPDPLSST